MAVLLLLVTWSERNNRSRRSWMGLRRNRAPRPLGLAQGTIRAKPASVAKGAIVSWIPGHAASHGAEIERAARGMLLQAAPSPHDDMRRMSSGPASRRRTRRGTPPPRRGARRAGGGGV